MLADRQMTAGRDDAITIVLPALEEEETLPGTLASVASQSDTAAVEVILVDGGSRDRTVARFAEATSDWRARGWDASVVTSRKAGRAEQMNLGARLAAGEVILFLHADTHLPAGALRAVRSALRDPRVIGGGFRLRYREGGGLLRVIATWASARSVVRRIHYGDQAPFVRRTVFEEIGGFPEQPLFEDLRFARTLRRRGRVRTLPLAVRTSARRLRRGGTLRTAFHFASLKLRYALGADPARLKSEYPDVR